MARKWTSFDSATTNKEALSIPAQDRSALFNAMRCYKNEEGGFEVKNYGDGILMLKPTNQTSGRVLFFAVHEENGTELLTALLFYKKETNKIPASVLKRAQDRLKGTE